MTGATRDSDPVTVDPCAGCEHAPGPRAAQDPSEVIEFPTVRQVGLFAWIDWLRHGWSDIWRQPLGSIGFGVLLVLMGMLILYITQEHAYLYTASICGFVLVAPMLGFGLYEKSRRYQTGEPVPLWTIKSAWERNPSGLLGFGALCLLAGTLWQMVSVLMIAVLYKGGGMKPLAMIMEILRNPEHNVVFAMYWFVGALYAAVIFAFTVVSAPMLVDQRNCRLLSALGTSVNCVAENPVPLSLWAGVIMVMVGAGFATGLLGLIIVLPWLAHASFHAYRALVVTDP